MIFFVIFLLTAMVLEYQTAKNIKMCKEKSQAELAEKDSTLEDSSKKTIIQNLELQNQSLKYQSNEPMVVIQ